MAPRSIVLRDAGGRCLIGCVPQRRTARAVRLAVHEPARTHVCVPAYACYIAYRAAYSAGRSVKVMQCACDLLGASSLMKMSRTRLLPVSAMTRTASGPSR